MKTEMQKVLNLAKFFTLHPSTDRVISYSFTKSSLILLKNIYTSWLQCINIKSYKHVVYTTKTFAESRKKTLPFGYIANHVVKCNESTVIKHDTNDYATENMTSQLQFNFIVPQHTSMQYFLRWQRYRKYWWSSVTTTPSLFTINEVKYEEDRAYANIVAQFPWGQQSVETISMTSKGMEQNSFHLTCSMSLDRALFILLLDGLMNTKGSEYLKLHRSMAPYKISFVLNFTDTSNKNNLSELAYLMHEKLKSKQISSCLPDFTLSLEQQIKDNLQLGVTYTAVLCENTLTNGILHLLNSSTMLKEEVHVADFESYAALICGK